MTLHGVSKFKLILSDIVVPTGALVCSLWINKVMQSKAPVHFFILLWSCVWLIYIADRLIDARKLGAEAVTERHRFYHHYSKVFSTLCLLIFIGLLSYVWWLWQQAEMLRLLRFGNSMVWVCVLYFLYTQYFSGHLKEIFVAAIFWFGTVLFHLPALSSITIIQAAVASGLGLLYIANLMLFALIEENNDRQQNQGSVVIWLGEPVVKRVFRLILTLCVVLSILLFTLAAYINASIIIVMAAWLIFLATQAHMPALNRRLVADIMFFVPIAALITT